MTFCSAAVPTFTSARASLLQPNLCSPLKVIAYPTKPQIPVRLFSLRFPVIVQGLSPVSESTMIWRDAVQNVRKLCFRRFPLLSSLACISTIVRLITYPNREIVSRDMQMWRIWRVCGQGNSINCEGPTSSWGVEIRQSNYRIGWFQLTRRTKRRPHHLLSKMVRLAEDWMCYPAMKANSSHSSS